MVVSSGLRSTLRRSILQHFSGGRGACPRLPSSAVLQTQPTGCYTHTSIYTLCPPPPTFCDPFLPSIIYEWYLTLIDGYILSPGGLGMVGKVVNIQAWKKESIVSEVIGCLACDKCPLQVFHFYEDTYSSYSLRLGPSVPNFCCTKAP